MLRATGADEAKIQAVLAIVRATQASEAAVEDASAEQQEVEVA
jgi:hypothetical protein